MRTAGLAVAAAVGLAGCTARVVDPYVSARTVEECRTLAAADGIDPTLRGGERAIARGIQEARLSNCIARVSASAPPGGGTVVGADNLAVRQERFAATCDPGLGVMQGATGYCVDQP